ncbi:MAG: PA0069 family radical SAM protein [Pyrinomonadaceae bacterium]
MKLVKIENPPNRFRRTEVEWDEETPVAAVEVFEETAKSIITRNNSPDVGFEFSVNPYRGCTHACTYCFARNYHEFLGWGAGTDFETKIVVKTNAPELLRKELMRRSWKGDALAFSFTSDPYLPLEGSYELTRKCLEVCLEFRNPISIVTKSTLILRDLNLLLELNRLANLIVIFSLPVLDLEISRAIEPNTPTPSARLKAIEKLTAAGINVGLAVAPVIPGLTDSEIPQILRLGADAGVKFAFMSMLRLPGSVEAYFVAKLAERLPTKKDKILNRIREMRDGKLSNSNFGERMRGAGEHWNVITQLFRLSCKRYGINTELIEFKKDTFRRPRQQMSLFD